MHEIFYSPRFLKDLKRIIQTRRLIIPVAVLKYLEPLKI